MTDTNAPPPVTDMAFDIWFMPMVFWTQWWQFYAETLNVGRFVAKPEPAESDDALVHVEVEKGLVA